MQLLIEDEETEEVTKFNYFFFFASIICCISKLPETSLQTAQIEYSIMNARDKQKQEQQGEMAVHKQWSN